MERSAKRDVVVTLIVSAILIAVMPMLIGTYTLTVLVI